MLVETRDKADYIVFCAGLKPEIVQGVRNIYENTVPNVYVHEFVDDIVEPWKKSEECVKLLNLTLDVIHEADVIILSYSNGDSCNVSMLMGTVDSSNKTGVTTNVIIFDHYEKPDPVMKAYAEVNEFTYCDTYYSLYITLLTDARKLGRSN